VKLLKAQTDKNLFDNVQRLLTLAIFYQLNMIFETLNCWTCMFLRLLKVKAGKIKFWNYNI